MSRYGPSTGDVEKPSSATHHHLVVVAAAAAVTVFVFCMWLLAFLWQKVGGGHRNLLRAQVKRIDNCSSEGNVAEKLFMLQKYE